mgnify:CR=1 FL=1
MEPNPDISSMSTRVDTVADKQNAIQSRQDQKDAQGEPRKSEQAVQTGIEEQPAPPMPKQHLSKPGFESEMHPRPKFMATHYKGSGKLQGQVAIVTGGTRPVARA